MKGISSVISRIAKSTDNLANGNTAFGNASYSPEWKVYEHSRKFTVDL